jgi:hypothetical protein
MMRAGTDSVVHMNEPPSGTSTTTVTPGIRSSAAWMLLAVTGFLLFGWALYWLLPFSPDTLMRPPTLLDSAGMVLIAAPAFAVFLVSGLRPALPSAPAIEVLALTGYAVAATSHIGFLIVGLAGGSPFDSGYRAALEEMTAVAVQLLFLGLVIVAAAYVVSVRRRRIRGDADGES